MPRKTRQQKMAAALRRLKQQAQVQESVAATPEKIEKESQPEATTTQGYSLNKLKVERTSEKSKVKVAEQRYDYTHVSGDLKKIIFLSTLAIALEILLNLTMRAEFAKLLLRRFGIEI